MPISGSIVRIGHVQLMRDTSNEDSWLIKVPGHALRALNLSTVGTGVYGGSLTIY